MTLVNKSGEDWRITKIKLHELIAAAHANMERNLDFADYHEMRGHIALARNLIEWVEPTTPPVTDEDHYGISNPDEQE